jgi:transcriptional regulator with XRE-family HTH domain
MSKKKAPLVEIPPNNIKRLRQERKWSQMDLSIRSGVSAPIIIRAEAQKNVRLDSLVRIAQAFDVSMSDLFQSQ